MRKILSLLVILLLLIMLFSACGPPAAEQEPPEEKKVRVALIVTSYLGDGNNADDMNAGLQRAAADFGVETAIYEALEVGVREEALRSYAQEGYDLIITCFAGMNEPVDKVAADFSDISFAVNYTAGYQFKSPNATAYDYDCWESNYVCGVMGALVSESGMLGHISGGQDSNIVANYNAYVKGAQSINPDISVEWVNAGSFNDAAKGKEIALSLYAKGVDVILGDANVTTMGIIEAAVETGKYTMGDAVDHSQYGAGNVLMDTALGFGNGVYRIIEMYLNGELDGETKHANYVNEAIGTFKNMAFAENCADEELAARMDEVWAKIEEVEGKLTSGEIVVEKDTNLPA